MDEITGFFIIIGVLSLIELVLKGFALYKSAQKGEKAWFVSILVINTLGILPALYLLFFSKKNVNKS